MWVLSHQRGNRMNIIASKKKEVIRVLHNNLDDMTKNCIQLKKEGWSDNKRVNASGVSLVKEYLQGNIEEVISSYPDVEIQYPKTASIRLSFIYVTEHERELKE